ncbi:MAG: hypothetical protein JXR80_09035 [Deltaproteobacteria bacterium]|nr:hypothetical protein [Deltaproteobacteria bacterium]
MFIGNPYNLLVSGKKLIGWGSGGVFEYFHSLFPLPLACLVDNSSKAQKTIKMGLKIYSPEVLQKEDPQQVFLIVYSSFSVEIMRHISRLGSFNSINASVLFCFDYKFQWQRINRVLEQPFSIRRQNVTDSALLIQGQILPELTAKIVSYYAHCYPDIQIIFSTWQGVAKVLIDEVEPFVDHLLLNNVPEFPGVQNRNMQIVSTRAGLEYCLQKGIKTVLKTRSDIFITAHDVFKQCKSLLKYYEPKVCQQFGLFNRIIIPQSFTRKYLLYSPSDLAMYGTVEDLLRFWSIPLDDRQFDLLEECQTRNLKNLSLDGMPAECFLGVNFCRTIGRSLGGDLLDSWQFYRDFFIVLDNSWLGLFWPKNPHIPDTYSVAVHRETVGNAFWHALLTDTVQQDIGSVEKVDTDSQCWC